jgi:ferric-dicitrate binding protein FerR (iron transport regulator)
MADEQLMWLIARYLNGEASTSETRRLENWMEVSGEHRRQFAELRRIWSHRAASPTFDSHAAFAKLQSKLFS